MNKKSIARVPFFAVFRFDRFSAAGPAGQTHVASEPEGEASIWGHQSDIKSGHRNVSITYTLLPSRNEPNTLIKTGTQSEPVSGKGKWKCVLSGFLTDPLRFTRIRSFTGRVHFFCYGGKEKNQKKKL